MQSEFEVRPMWGGPGAPASVSRGGHEHLQPSSLPAEAPDTVEEKQARLAVPSLLYVSPQTGFGEMCGFVEPGGAVYNPSSVISQLRDAGS